MVRRLEHRRDRKGGEPSLGGDGRRLAAERNRRVGASSRVVRVPAGEAQLREEHPLGNKCATVRFLHHKLQTQSVAALAALIGLN